MPRPQTFILPLGQAGIGHRCRLAWHRSGRSRRCRLGPARDAPAARPLRPLPQRQKNQGRPQPHRTCARAQGRRRRPGTHPRPSCGEPHVPVSSPRQRPPHAAEKAVERRADCRAWPMDRCRGRVAARRTGHRGQARSTPRKLGQLPSDYRAGVRPRPLAG